MQPPQPEIHVTRGPDQTRALAATLAGRFPPGAVIALVGDLGAGKTCFVQGLAEAVGITGPVNSPTYTLINEYDGDHRIVHFDIYRLRRPDELLQLGWEEYLDDPATWILVEWADRAGDLIPTAWRITIEHGNDEDERRITLLPGAAS